MKDKSTILITVIGINPVYPCKTPDEDTALLKNADLVGYYDSDKRLTPDTEIGNAVRSFTYTQDTRFHPIPAMPLDEKDRTLADVHDSRIAMESFLKRAADVESIVFIIPCDNFLYPGDPSEKSLLDLEAQFFYESHHMGIDISKNVRPMWPTGDPQELLRRGKEFSYILSRLPEGWYVCDDFDATPKGVILVHEHDPDLKDFLRGRNLPAEVTGMTEEVLSVYVPDTTLTADDLIDTVKLQAKLNDYDSASLASLIDVLRETNSEPALSPEELQKSAEDAYPILQYAASQFYRLADSLEKDLRTYRSRRS